MSSRKITILGGGQAGLQLASGLLQRGYEVKLVQNRTADEIRTGRVMSSQCMFGAALQNVRGAYSLLFLTEKGIVAVLSQRGG